MILPLKFLVLNTKTLLAIVYIALKNETSEVDKVN